MKYGCLCYRLICICLMWEHMYRWRDYVRVLPSSNTTYIYVRNLGFGLHYSQGLYILYALVNYSFWLCGLHPREARQPPQGTGKWNLVRYILHLIKGEQNLLLLYSGRAQEVLSRMSPLNSSWGDFLTGSQGSRAVRLRLRDEGSGCTALCPICRTWTWPCMLGKALCQKSKKRWRKEKQR